MSSQPSRLKSFYERRDLTKTVAPMGLGSVTGAVAGGPFVGFTPEAFLKLLLVIILIASTIKTFHPG